MDFKSFNKSAPKQPADKKEERKVNPNDVREAEELAKKYSGKSEDELMEEIFARVNQSKRNGTFDQAELDKFYKTVAPMLNGEQLKKLKNILSMIK